MISPPKKILAMKLRSLGDTVLMTAALSELKKTFPYAEIHVAVTSAWAPLLEGHPAVHRLWTYDRYNERAARAKTAARLALKLRRERFDCVVNFHASPSSAMVAFATGARLRAVHFHGHMDKNRYSTVVVPGKGVLKPIIERDMDTVRALGTHVPQGRLPTIYLKDEEREQARLWRKNQGLSGALLMLGLGASRPTKTWPMERFAALALDWATHSFASGIAGSVLAVAGPDEAQESYRFLKAVDDLLPLTISDLATRANVRSRISSDHRLPLRHLAAMMSEAQVFMGNDSGPRHIAVAVGTPTLTLFGPENPFEWHPYPTDRHPYLFIENLSCRKDALEGYPAWCGLDVCVVEHHQCMLNFGVDQVFQSCLRLAEAPGVPL